MIYNKKISQTQCPNTGKILSDSKKFWLADVPWLTVICSPAVASLIIFNP